MPPPGTWLLTGQNGAGKTTLLACLDRLGNRLAFPQHFMTSRVSDRLDSFSKSKVSFSINEETVTYSYSGVRWMPKPKNKAKIVAGFGYAGVLYVGANAERVTPKPEDFEPKKIHSVPQPIKDAANRIFDTKKFDQLRKVNVTRGNNQAFVFRVGASYYSEKNFSLGELCTLKLILKVQHMPANSLIVVDELEMALHPSAQVRLFQYLDQVGSQAGHTIIFSTHSVSLIKSVDRKQILYLRREGDGVIVEKEPYLSAVLGGLAFVEEKSADTVIYVEDYMAELATRTLVRLVAAERLKHKQNSRPKVEVVPIGGFAQVVAFLKRHDALHRASVKSYALLDLDVKDETVSGWEAENNHIKLAWFQEYENRIEYLPWTPEKGIVDLYLRPENQLLEFLRSNLDDAQLSFPPKAGEIKLSANRKECKNWVREVVEYWSEHFAIEPNRSREALCAAIATTYFEEHRSAALSKISPLIS